MVPLVPGVKPRTMLCCELEFEEALDSDWAPVEAKLSVIAVATVELEDSVATCRGGEDCRVLIFCGGAGRIVWDGRASGLEGVCFGNSRGCLME